MKKIVLATDGSNHAERAAELAGDIAKMYDAEVVVVHAIDEHRVSDADRKMAAAEFPERLAEAHNSRTGELGDRYDALLTTKPVMDEFFNTDGIVRDILGEQTMARARDILKAHGVEPAQTLIQKGNPVDIILGAAKEVGADTIILGSRGRSGLVSALLGSVSLEVGHASDANVITVK